MHYTSNLQSSDLSIFNTAESENKIYKFLEDANIKVFKNEPIPSDASKRRYYRILTGSGSYILMDSSLEMASLNKFIEIDQYLRSIDLNAPKILSADIENGFLLLEDLGRDLFTKHLNNNTDDEVELYDNAIDLLLKLHEAEPLNTLPIYDNARLNSELEVFLEWYVKFNIDEKLYKNCAKELISIFESLYNKLDNLKKVTVLKDYMADNLLWIPKNNGVDKVGLLDFQDALIGSTVYDLSSLLQDARRDVSTELETHCLNRFNGGEVSQDFMDAYNIIALQKNLRIIGVFHRLNLKYAKPKYMSFIPRMLGYVSRNLEKEVLKDVKNWFMNYDIPQNI